MAVMWLGKELFLSDNDVRFDNLWTMGNAPEKEGSYIVAFEQFPDDAEYSAVNTALMYWTGDVWWDYRFHDIDPKYIVGYMSVMGIGYLPKEILHHKTSSTKFDTERSET